MKKTTKYYLITVLSVILFIGVFAVYLSNKADTKQVQGEADQAKLDNEKEFKRQELSLQKESLEKKVQAKTEEGQSYKKLSDTYCGYLTPPDGYIIRQTDYQTYFQQCEEYKRKAIGTYNEARTISIELESINKKIESGSY